MNGIRHVLNEGICPFLPLWRSLLVLEMAFVVLLAISVLLSSGTPNVAVLFSLLFIVPTSVGLLILIRYCERQ